MLIDILAHELGHLLGLENAPDYGIFSIMSGILDIDTAPRIPSVSSRDCQTADTIWHDFTRPEEDPCREIPKVENQEPCDHSPLVIDVYQDGFRFSGPEGAVHFDLFGNGEPVKITWVLPDEDDVFLFHDIDGNRLCDDGSELFGNGTRLHLEGLLARDGFEALRQFDHPDLGGNGDSWISQEDAIWQDLLAWHDRNADGICTPNEVWPLQRRQINQLDAYPSYSSLQDDHGNRLKYWGKAISRDLSIEREFDVVDVFFARIDE